MKISLQSLMEQNRFGLFIYLPYGSLLGTPARSIDVMQGNAESVGSTRVILGMGGARCKETPRERRRKRKTDLEGR
jgi:hypothetical protein